MKSKKQKTAEKRLRNAQLRIGLQTALYLRRSDTFSDKKKQANKRACRGQVVNY